MALKATISKLGNTNENFLIQKKYDIYKGQYGVWETKKNSNNFIPKGSAIFIDEIVNHIDTGEKYLKLYFFDSQGNKVSMTFPRKDLTEQGIMSLLGYGAQIIKQDAKILISTIMNQEPEASCILQHNSLGFSQYDGNTVFLAEKSIGVESEYNGKLQIGKKGKYKKWKKMVKEEVIGNISLEFILAVGGSGVMTDYLREKVQVENVIVSMVGESSTGKSTAGLLMVSCGAKPSFQGDSLVLNFSDTQNAIIATIPSSYPVLIDEGSLCRYNPTSFLYSLAMGKEKKRLTKDLDEAESAYFSTAIAITSEKSLINLADENSGLLVRVMEIGNIVWTKSAESADRIKEVIQNNYGWLVPKLAEEVLAMEERYGEEEIISEYKEWQEYLVERAKEKGFYNNFTERACKQYALILLSADFINYAMDFELNTDEMITFIEKHSLVKDAASADIGWRAFSYLMQYISEHYSQFLLEDNAEDFAPKDCLGRIKKVKTSVLKNGKRYHKRLYITDIALQEILDKGNFPDEKVILKRWKEEKILKSEKDRYLSDIQIIKDIPAKGYVINIPEQEENQLKKENEE